MQLIRVAERLGASSRRRRHPYPRPDGGGQSWPCTCVHGPKKTPHEAHHSHDELSTPVDELQLRNLDLRPHDVANRRHVNNLVQEQHQLRRLHSLLHCLNHPAPVVAQRRAMNQVQERERKLHGFLHCLDKPLSCNNGQDNQVQERVQKLHDFLHCLDQQRHLSSQKQRACQYLQELHQLQLRSLHSLRHCPTPSNCRSITKAAGTT